MFGFLSLFLVFASLASASSFNPRVRRVPTDIFKELGLDDDTLYLLDPNTKVTFEVPDLQAPEDPVTLIDFGAKLRFDIPEDEFDFNEFLSMSLDDSSDIFDDFEEELSRFEGSEIVCRS